MKLEANNRVLDLTQPVVMGILNVTPDSFSDGGRFNSVDTALERVEQMVKAGVTIIDIGGESTRPGAPEVSVEEEIDRVVPVVKAIREKFDIWLSIDTSKAEVMRLAIEAGADIINDVRSLTEPGALGVVAKANVPVCIMHMQGEPSTMQQNPQYQNLLTEVHQFLEERIQICVDAGIKREKLILDPGFGFGKTVEHNYSMLAHLEEFHQYNLPVLAGMSRKSMLFKLLDKQPQQCMAASVASATIAAMKGAQIIRVHDFEETLDAVRVVNAVSANY